MCGAVNKEITLHRLMNQRRVAYSLIKRISRLLEPGVVFSRALNQLFREQGKFGSRDRRLYRELTYAYLRYQPWLDPLAEKESAFMDSLVLLASPTKETRSLYPTLPSHPPNLHDETHRHRLIGKSDRDLRDALPEWFESALSQALDDNNALSLFARPPLWLRIQQGDPDSIVNRLCEKGGATKANDIHPVWGVPGALHCPADFQVAQTKSYAEGAIEIQDISSQLLLQLIHPKPKGHWLDACAGAGGKSLQLAKMLGSNGHVSAYDPRRKALEELRMRQKRARLTNIETLESPPTRQRFDGVLVDAPCSGSGTWRRHPYLMRQIRESDIPERARVQREILTGYATNVVSGGTLAYCTCSLFRSENEEIVERFLQAHPQFDYAPLATDFGFSDSGRGITIFPASYDGDGLFIATFRRK